MKPILVLVTLLATLTTVFSVSASQPQEKQLVFQAGREGESLAWYLLNQQLVVPNPQQQNDRKLYEVTLEIHERYFRQQPRTPGQSPFQGSRPILEAKTYQTAMWVNCSTRDPFVANESLNKPGYLDVLHLNPAKNSMLSGSRYFNLYWAVCHNLWDADSVLWSGEPADATSLRMQSSRQLADSLGYPSTLTYQSETISKQTLLGSK